MSDDEEVSLFATRVPPGGLTVGLQAIAALIDESEPLRPASHGGERKRKSDSLGTAQVHLALSGLAGDCAEPMGQRRRRTDDSADDSGARRSSQVPRTGAAGLVDALLAAPADVAIQLSSMGKLAEIACAPDGDSVWRAGAIKPCVRALARFHDVAICWKACAVLQFIALHSAAAAADCVGQGAVRAIASRLVTSEDEHSKTIEMQWRALSALQALCATDGSSGAVAITQLASCAGLAARLRAILEGAEQVERDLRCDLLLEPAGWLLERVFDSEMRG